MTYTYTNTNQWTNFHAVTESGVTVDVPAGATITLEERLLETPVVEGDEFAPAPKAKKKRKLFTKSD